MAKKKPKFPIDREKQSEAFRNGLVSVSIYTTHPSTDISIKGKHSEELQSDLQNAIDDVLKYHGQ